MYMHVIFYFRSVYTSTHTRINIQMYMHITYFRCVHISDMHVCVCVCVCVYIYIYIYMYMYICIYAQE